MCYKTYQQTKTFIEQTLYVKINTMNENSDMIKGCL